MKIFNVENVIKLVAFLSILLFGLVMMILVSNGFILGLFGAEEELPLGNRADLSMAMTTIFAMILGTIALLVIVQVESSGYKAKEAFKKDILNLTSSMNSIMRKMSFYFMNNNNDKISTNYLNLKKEHDVLNEFINSTSMVALVIWMQNNYNEKLRDNKDLPANLEWLRHSLDNYNNLLEDVSKNSMFESDLRHYRTEILDSVFLLRASLAKIAKEDIEKIASNVANLGNSLSNYLNADEADVLINSFMGYAKKRNKETDDKTESTPFDDDSLKALLSHDEVKNNPKLVSEINDTYQRYIAGDKAALGMLKLLQKRLNLI